MTDEVQIRFVGHGGIRELDGYRWDPENNHVCSVDLETAAKLLRYPHPQFHLVKNQPMTAATQAKLAELIGFKPADIERVVETVAVPPQPKITDLKGIGEARAADLAAQGVTSLADLAKQDDEGIKNLSANTGASRSEIVAWVKQAKELMEANNG